MRIFYVLSEAVNNIRRNGLVVLGAVLAVFISLFLTFGTLIFGEIARVNTLQWSDDVRVIGFLRDDFRSAEQLRSEVQGWVEVDEVFYISKPEAYEEALVMFADDPATLRVFQENPQIAPASIRVRPAELDQYEVIEQRLRNTPGVDRVVSAGAAVDQIAAIRDGLRVFFWVLAAALGIAAVALIANTIHMAIYARREELEIMKLVGAGSWYVRTPFWLEGMIEGLIGAALAVAVTFGLYELAVDNLQGGIQWVDLEVSREFLRRWSVIFLGVGLAVGFFGSSISLAVHRHIRR
jgi:cell division transport system permease protein